MDDKPLNMANTLKDTLRNSKCLRENLKPLCKILKRIAVCIAAKPVSWLEDFQQAGGFNALNEIIIDYKTKYSTLYNNPGGSLYFNPSNMSGNLSSQAIGGSSGTAAGVSLAVGGGYSINEFKDKDTQLSKEIRFECMKILKSFVNTSYGIKIVLESKQSLMAIATAIDCNDAQSMNVACQLLAGLAVLE